ncbi:shikimate dehydrogenase [Arthrobacter sp. SRS-W-1-2016]|nr:shikimate dehydrogenase [Arthrobacter sp. SRS-W-1-2016]
METSTSARRLFLIGSEASKAMSPDLWNPVLRKMTIGWSYEAWDVPAGASMAEVRAKLLETDVVAANVTMPHKQWAAGAGETVTDPVRLSGAANLLVRHEKQLEAHNTDITAVTALHGDRSERHAVMFGAGGAARATLVALKDRVDHVSIADRDSEASRQLLELAARLGMDASETTWDGAQRQALRASLIVNATPLGKNRQDGPVWGMAGLADDAMVYDFVYAKHVTASIASAKEQGLRYADGWDHLREQAAAMVPVLGLPPQTGLLLERTLATIHGGSAAVGPI